VATVRGGGTGCAFSISGSGATFQRGKGGDGPAGRGLTRQQWPPIFGERPETRRIYFFFPPAPADLSWKINKAPPQGGGPPPWAGGGKAPQSDWWGVMGIQGEKNPPTKSGFLRFNFLVLGGGPLAAWQNKKVGKFCKGEPSKMADSPTPPLGILPVKNCWGGAEARGNGPGPKLAKAMF